MSLDEHFFLDDPLIGRQLANFRLERALGRGGMAQVYYGWDVKLQRPVAVKVIDARFRDNPTYAARFVREAQTIAQWRHENIIQIHYADDEDGLYYFVMEYINGQDLGQLIARYGAKDQLLPHAEVLRIGRAVASALDYAHQRSVIHRDVKPSNVMMAEDGRVVLTDFGLALDVQQGSLGEIFGSAHYIAPEQARDSAAAVPQSDLYALAIILYEMLTGAVPFDDPSPTTVAVQHLTALPPPPRDLNPALNRKTEAVLLKALSKSPRLRFQAGSELMSALEQALQSDSSASAKGAEPLPIPEAPTLDPTEAVEYVPPPPPELDPPVARRVEPWPVPAPVIPSSSTAMPVAKRSNPLLIMTVGLLLALGVACLLIGALIWGRGSDNDPSFAGGAASTAVIVFTAAPPPTSTPTPLPPTSPPSETPTATSTPRAIIIFTQTPTSIPTETPTATSIPTEPPTLVPTLTETPTVSPTPELPTPPPLITELSSYDLLIARRGDDSLLVINQTAEAFPLASLRLGDEQGAIYGTEWGLETLEYRACVTAWQDEGNPKPPDVACTEVGNRLTRPKGERFWADAFNVYYNEELVSTCDRNRCPISIPK